MLDSIPVVLGVTAMVGSLVAAGIVLYLLVSRREQQPQPEPVERRLEPGSAPEPSGPAKGAKRAKAVRAHSLFVIFPAPTVATQQALAAWLRKVEARYDSVYEVFNVAGEQPANPVKVANAFPPGTLPNLLAAEAAGDAAPLRGISLLVKAPLRPSRNQQMHLFVALARELEALGGQVLDADREPATEATYAAILGEQ
ncbi:cell division protein ZipA C-terminal FtsZ-binding domain-containing protein [Halomonas mongoliensis]|uniref:cell division protein ZipA C-terminal FtsZ-binding domain-containing protein n=1 Tax=Halomonas mongoliensis TaxID=321265 RepID=UPI00403B294D